MEQYMVKSAIMGSIVGDSLGVPYEFKSRYNIDLEEVKQFKGYGTHNVPPGFWSDDSSLILATLEGLSGNIWSNTRIGENFVKWLYYNKYTPSGRIFDVGRTTRDSISKIKFNHSYVNGLDEDMDNGNGSLMRMIPIALYLYDHPEQDIGYMVKTISQLTHGTHTCIMGCCIYVQYALNLLRGHGKYEAYDMLKADRNEPFYHMICYNDIFDDDISEVPEDEIYSSGYIVDTLESTLWCFINSSSYDESVLKAISLGGDTDTLACLVGGLSGIYYGYNSINKDWLDKIVRKERIFEICDKFARS